MIKSRNTTREGIRVRPGQVWRDLDIRSGTRLVMVRSVTAGKATVTRWRPVGGIRGGRTTVLTVARMYRHTTGWQMVSKKEGT